MSTPPDRNLEAYSFRPATTDDLPALLSIEHKVHKAPWTEEHFRTELEKPYSHSLLLTDDETDTQIAGYVVFWILAGDCQILNLAVDLTCRGVGMGQRLVSQVVNAALKAGIEKITLDVRRSNSPALQLYQKTKFTITHVRKAFYSDGEDAYQMTLDLKGEVVDF